MEVLVHSFGGAAADFGVAGSLVVAQLETGGFVELWQQVEGDVGGLIVARIGAGDVVAERTEGGLAREGTGLGAGGEIGGVEAGHESGGDGFDVAFDAGDLAGEEDFGARAQLQVGVSSAGALI